MGSAIKVVDNFLDTETLKQVFEIVKSGKWQYDQTSHNEDSTVFWIMHLNNNEFLLTKLLKIIEDTFNKKFEAHRVYANGQTKDQPGDFHEDYDENFAIKTGCWTFLLYLTPEIDERTVDTIGGYTQFKYNNKLLSVEPIFNRCVLFNSYITHRGCAPNTKNILRISLALKLIEK